jgi:DNA polymerase elongation subunit (family B)
MKDAKAIIEAVENNNVAAIAKLVKDGTLVLEGNTLKFPAAQGKIYAEYWDKLQLVKKLMGNGSYGAILNAGCLFNDRRMGQSATLTGRMIVKGMTEEINNFIAGKPDHLGDSVLYNDTDSCYFTAWPMVKDDVEGGRIEWSKEIAIKLYDSVADHVNKCFPEIMEKNFNCPLKYGEIIKAGREIVATSGLFITKKRYALLYYDKDGKRYDTGCEGKVKAMGLDLKRADTPQIVQVFLLDVLTDVLHGVDQELILDKIVKFKELFKAMKPWEKGSPKRVNNLTKYSAKETAKGTAAMPGHVRAAKNWNTLREMNRDNYSMPIRDGQKCIVCKIKPNAMGWTSVAYPTDELRLPDWFIELQFDEKEMEKAIVNQKLENLLGVLGWDILDSVTEENTFSSLFTIE